jgi:hypothetical protein
VFLADKEQKKKKKKKRGENKKKKEEKRGAHKRFSVALSCGALFLIQFCCSLPYLFPSALRLTHLLSQFVSGTCID